MSSRSIDADHDALAPEDRAICDAPRAAGSRTRPEGSFKVAKMHYRFTAENDRAALDRWLAEVRVVKWDSRPIVRKRGRLDQLA